MNIKNYFLPESEYFPKETKKTQIVLHHTVSSGTAESVGDWFKKQAGKIGVAFVIDKLGNVICLFDPKYWAYHLGLKASNNVTCNQKSIGIELVNEGILTRQSIGKNVEYKWTYGDYSGKVFQNPTCWRGSYFYADYNAAQIFATAELCKKLCADFGIPKNVLGNFEFSKTNLDYNGIIGHCNVRADKSDISPAFDYQSFYKILNS